MKVDIKYNSYLVVAKTGGQVVSFHVHYPSNIKSRVLHSNLGHIYKMNIIRISRDRKYDYVIYLGRKYFSSEFDRRIEESKNYKRNNKTCHRSSNKTFLLYDKDGIPCDHMARQISKERHRPYFGADIANTQHLEKVSMRLFNSDSFLHSLFRKFDEMNELSITEYGEEKNARTSFLIHLQNMGGDVLSEFCDHFSRSFNFSPGFELVNIAKITSREIRSKTIKSSLKISKKDTPKTRVLKLIKFMIKKSNESGSVQKRNDII